MTSGHSDFLIPSSSFFELLLLFLRRRWRLRVVERSMLPTLREGDEVLVDRRAYAGALPQVGDVVIILHPVRNDFKLIKRVERVREDGSCFVVGDNSAESTDSRSWGWIPREKLLGRVTSYLG